MRTIACVSRLNECKPRSGGRPFEPSTCCFPDQIAYNFYCHGRNSGLMEVRLILSFSFFSESTDAECCCCCGSPFFFILNFIYKFFISILFVSFFFFLILFLYIIFYYCSFEFFFLFLFAVSALANIEGFVFPLHFVAYPC